MNELVRALEACRGTSPGPDEIRPRICFNLFRGVNGTPICVPKPFLLHGRLQLASRGWGLTPHSRRWFESRGTGSSESHGGSSVLAQILDKIEALSSELSEVKAQTQQFNERLARQEEAVSRPRQVEAEVEVLQPQEPSASTRRDEEIEELRRQLHEKEEELQREKQRNRERRNLQPPETQLRFSENPEDYVQRPTSARLPPEPRPRSSPEYADPRLPQGTPQLTAAAQRGSYDSSTSRALTPAVSYVVARESVPHFKGDTSASQPLKRNQDVEAWIRSIENLVKPPTDEAYIQAARANCRGPAELIINSPLFDFIRDWETFKASLRTKFRGTYTSADFYKVLYENRMSSVQAPMDFYLQLEGHVYQGLRKQPRGYGTPGTGSGMNQLHDISLQNEFRLDDDRDHRHYPDRPPRARDLYACPIAAQVDRVKTPQLIPPQTSPATVAEDLGTWLDNVPFRVASKEKLPVQLAEFQKGAVTSTSTQTETTMSQIAMLSSLGLSGRPLVGLNINGKTTLCFIDTGSEATLIKPSAVAMIVSHQKLQHRRLPRFSEESQGNHSKYQLR
ncbi:hypothetical protein C7M84_017979 [Penaeus vannamei]|uniref:Uncharacterized protein n=1 Tax=Penaeus vannamei TaxID=6689 RepID=A0A3R7PF24_PENVA|nr:hypothetical protein C7M84_017979 [Penaeus vannamei]